MDVIFHPSTESRGFQRLLRGRKSRSGNITPHHFSRIMERSTQLGLSLNSLWPSDAIWWYRSRLTSAHVLVACRHQAITWTSWLIINGFYGIHMKGISLEVLISIREISLKITLLNSLLHFPGCDELTMVFNKILRAVECSILLICFPVLRDPHY